MSRLLGLSAAFLVFISLSVAGLGAAEIDEAEVVPQRSASLDTIDPMLDSLVMEVSPDGKTLVTRSLIFPRSLTVWSASGGARLRDITVARGGQGLTSVMSRDGSIYAMKPGGLTNNLRTGKRIPDQPDYIAEISTDGRYLLTLDWRSFRETAEATPELRAGRIVDLETKAVVSLPVDTNLLESGAWTLPSNKFLLNHGSQWRVIDPAGAKATVVLDLPKPYPAPPEQELAKLFRNEPSELMRLARADNDNLIYARETPAGVAIYARPLISELNDVGLLIISPSGRYISRRDKDEAKVQIWDTDKLVVDKSYDGKVRVVAFHPTQPWVYVAFFSQKYATGLKVSALHLPDLAPVYDLGNAGIADVELSLGATGLEVAAARRVGEKEPSRGAIFSLAAIAAGGDPILLGPDQPITELKEPPPDPNGLQSFLDTESKMTMTDAVRNLLGFSTADDANILSIVANRRAAAEKALSAAADETEKAVTAGDTAKATRLQEEMILRRKERDATLAGALDLPGSMQLVPSGLSDSLEMRPLFQVKRPASLQEPPGNQSDTYTFRPEKVSSNGEPTTVSVHPFETGPRTFELMTFPPNKRLPVTTLLKDDRVRSDPGGAGDGLITTLKGGELVTRHQSGQIAIWDGRSGRLLRTIGTECSVKNLQAALGAKGFYKGTQNGRLDGDVKAALVKFFADVKLSKMDSLLSDDADKADASKAIKLADFKTSQDLTYFACQMLGFFGHTNSPDRAALVEGSDVLITSSEDSVMVSSLTSGTILAKLASGPGSGSMQRIGFAVLDAGQGKPTFVPLKHGRNGSPPRLVWPAGAAGQKVMVWMDGSQSSSLASEDQESYGSAKWLRWPDLSPVAQRPNSSVAAANWNTNLPTVDRPGEDFAEKSVALAGEPFFTVGGRDNFFVTELDAKLPNRAGPVPFPVFADPHVLSAGRAVAGLDGNRLLVSTHASGELAVWDSASGAYLRSFGTPCDDRNLTEAFAQWKLTDATGAPVNASEDLERAIATLFAARNLKNARSKEITRPDGSKDYEDVPIKASDFADLAHRRNLACTMLGMFGHDKPITTAAFSKTGTDDTAPQLVTLSGNSILVSDTASGKTIGLARFGGKIESVGAALLKRSDQSVVWQTPAGLSGGVVELVWPKPPAGDDTDRVLIVRTAGGSVYRLGFPDLVPQSATERGLQQVNVWSLQPKRSLKMVFLGNAAGEWIGLAPSGFYAATPQGSELIRVVRGMESWPLAQFTALKRPDLLLELWKGDPDGKYKDAVNSLDFQGLAPKTPN
jgi:hypothetical protein